MCESLPSACLPPPGSLPASGGRGAGLPRRAVVAGLGALLLTGCMPTRRARRRAEAAGDAAACAPTRRPTPPALRIVPRSAWGAEPLKDNHDPMTTVTRITVHHTAEIAGMGERSGAELVKGIQHFHRNVRGWADIGYHWVIGRDGFVYEGRALGVQGAHAGGGNNVGNLGISVIGDYSTGLPPAPALATLERFLRAQQQRYGVGMDAVFGHREFKATACPGDALFGWLTGYRQRA